MIDSAPREKSKFLCCGRNMFAALKLEGIDGRAPPGVAVAFFASTREKSPGLDTVRIDTLIALS